MGDTTKPAPDLVNQLLKNAEFVSDLARYNEQLCTELFIRRKYGNLSEATWTQLGESDELVHAIELASQRRCRDGSSKRELAQKYVVKGPEILSGIACDSKASPRHRVDAIRTLDHLADNGPDSPAARDVFQITINLGGGDILRFGGSRTPDPNDGKTTINHNHVDVIEHDTTTDDDDDDIPRWIPLPADPKDSGAGGAPSW